MVSPLIRKLPFLLLIGLLTTRAVNAQAPVAKIGATVSAGCSPLIVNFSDQSTGGAATTWAWNFGALPPDVNPPTSNQPTPVVVFNKAGTYNVTLTVTNASGSSTSAPFVITVYPSPTADFTADKTSGCFPLPVNFTDNTNPGAGASITNWLWDFGDGTTFSTAQNPSHTYGLNGNFPVTLFVKNSFGCQGSSALKTITGYIAVSGGISPSFSDSASGSCKPPTTVFYDNQTSGPGTITYAWDFGDGGTATGATPQHTFNASGTYQVRMIATSNQGCFDTLILPTTILSGSVNSGFIAPDSACVGTNITFQNTSSPTPNTSTWSFGDGNTTTAPSTSHVYAAPGTYNVTLKNDFATCDDSVSKQIKVLNPPVANFTAVTSTTSCKAPLTVNFQDQSTNATSWVWNFGDGTLGSGPNPSHTYTTFGKFDVILVASNASGCSGTITKSAFVQVAAPSITITNLPAYGCAPLTFTPNLSANVVDGIASYAWDFGNGNTSTAANPPAQLYGAGKYLVKLTITSNGGCTASFSDSVKVGTIKPTAAFTAAPTTVCIGQNVQFTDQSTGGANQWSWDFGDGNTSTLQNPPYSYTQPGTFTVKLTAYNDGCFDVTSKTNYITVNPPMSKFTYAYNCNNKSQYIFTDQSIGPVTTWDWDFGDGSAHGSGPGPVSHTYAANGNYTVVLKVSNGGCTNPSSQLVSVGQKIDFLSSSYSICKNTEITISTINNGNILEYTYDFGDGTRVGPGLGSNLKHTYTTTGNFAVTVITKDTTGCMDSVTKPNFIMVNGPTAAFTTPTTMSCGSLSATFTDQSTISNGVAIASWFWDFGDGTTSNQSNPNHVYTVQGIYPVKVRVTDAAGCSDSLVKPSYITVSIPTAKFTTIDSMFCPTSQIKFTNASLGGFNPSYSWDFGNGTFNGVNPPLHTYPLVNSYTVLLTVKDIYNCTATYSKSILVDTPAASFTMDDSVASCPPLITNFTFTGHYNKSVQWNFGDGGASDSLNPQRIYSIPGIDTVVLTVTSPGQCIARASKIVKIFGPYGAFSYTPLGGCDSLTVNFTIATSGVIGYTWYFGNGDSVVNTLPAVTYRYDHPGSYTPVITLKDTSNCNVPITGSKIIVVDSVKAKFIVDKNTVCQTGSIQFTDTSFKSLGTIISNYVWDFGDGSGTISGNFRTPSHFYAAPGTYNVKMIVTTQFGCTDSMIMPIKVVANPTISIGGVLSQCVPATLNFTGNIVVPDTSAFRWAWDFDNGQTSTLQTPPAQIYNKAGHYVIQLTATNSSNCSTTDSADLFIFPIPNVSAGLDTTICLGQSVMLNATGAAGYQWLPPTSSDLSCTNCPNPVTAPTVTTSYFVTGTSPDGCQATDTIQVKVNGPVTVNATPIADSVCLGQSIQLTASGTEVYAWSPAAGLSNANIANPIASPTTSTTYQVVGSDAKYCFSDTASVQVSVFNYPTINLGPDVTINVGGSYQIPGSGSADIVSINWLPTTALSCTNCLSPLATPKKTTTYVSTVVNNGTCATSDSLTITVICNNTNFFVPNTFSPNGDGMNDVFFVRGKGLNIIPSMIIYNRWGQIVFEKRDFAPNDPSVGWDGNFNGTKAPSDVYIYTIEIICDNSTLIPYHGNITLIR